MTKIQKIYIVIAGIVLALTAFLIGKSFSKNVVQLVPVQNNTDTATSTPSTDTQKKSIFDLANEYKPYSIGEARVIAPVDFVNEVDTSVGLAGIHDIKYIHDDKNLITYRFFRVGYDDEPPTYYAGRIIVETTYYDGTPDYHWNYFVTEIADLNYIGKIKMQGNEVIIDCDNLNNSSTCSYSIQYHKDTSKLSVKKLK